MVLNRSEKQIKNSIHVIENNLQLDMHEATARRHAKNYLIATGGNKCTVCGVKEWMGQPVPLVCDHIDGSSNNNSIENFRLVCCNCDAQLPTYKSKNKNSGRSYDREYHRLRRGGRVV